jgi:hypothetical protein
MRISSISNLFFNVLNFVSVIKFLLQEKSSFIIFFCCQTFQEPLETKSSLLREGPRKISAISDKSKQSFSLSFGKRKL